MKIDLKQIQNLASQMPDIISKGQQAVNAVNSIMDMTKSVKQSKTSAEEENQIESNDEKTTPEFVEAEVVSSGGDENQETSDNIDLVGALATLNTPVAVATTIKDMVQQANETIRFCEEQETIRTEIRAKAAVEISKINAMADMVRDYLKRSFDERAGLFDNYFSVLDKALEKGDNTLVAQTLQSINSLAASSPFKDLADINKVTAILSEGGEWDI